MKHTWLLLLNLFFIVSIQTSELEGPPGYQIEGWGDERTPLEWREIQERMRSTSSSTRRAQNQPFCLPSAPTYLPMSPPLSSASSTSSGRGSSFSFQPDDLRQQQQPNVNDQVTILKITPQTNEQRLSGTAAKRTQEIRDAFENVQQAFATVIPTLKQAGEAGIARLVSATETTPSIRKKIGDGFLRRHNDGKEGVRRDRQTEDHEKAVTEAERELSRIIGLCHKLEELANKTQTKLAKRT